MTRKAVAGLAFLILHVSTAQAQSAMPTNSVLLRTVMVESQYGRGTIFSLDVDQREYWITAKHILTGAKHPPYGSIATKSVSLKILDPVAAGEKWVSVTFSVIDTEKDVDIVVLAPLAPMINNPLPSVVADSAGAFLGGDCEFLGFPYGGGWRAKFDKGETYWMPFVKHCTVSALTTEGIKIWVLDGINNAGFSGGPVIFRTGLDQRIMAVVSGYETEPADVILSASKRPKPNNTAAQPKGKVNLNSGFIITYDIWYAIDAIHKNPIGPLRKTN